jgi:hypothetical protein
MKPRRICSFIVTAPQLLLLALKSARCVTSMELPLIQALLRGMIVSRLLISESCLVLISSDQKFP